MPSTTTAYDHVLSEQSDVSSPELSQSSFSFVSSPSPSQTDTLELNDHLLSQNSFSSNQSVRPSLSEVDVDPDSLNEDVDALSDDSISDFRTDSEDEEQTDPDLAITSLYQPLYNGAEITICGAICAIMQFCTTYKLSYSAISGLLKLLIVLCPTPNHLPKSFYMLKKFFEQFQSNYEHSKYCVNCNHTVSNCICSNKSNCNTGHIVHLDIQKPLETIISGALKAIAYICTL